MTARLLELTQSVKVENIPARVSTDYITMYFESPRNGGGPVSEVQLFSEENSAIVTFCDRKGNTVLCPTRVLPGGDLEESDREFGRWEEPGLLSPKPAYTVRFLGIALDLEILLHVWGF